MSATSIHPAHNSPHQFDTSPVFTRTGSPAASFARALVALMAMGIGAIGAVFSFFCFVAADAASRGAGFIGCGDGIPDPSGARGCRVTGFISGIVTVIIVVALMTVATRSPGATSDANGSSM